MPTNGRVERHFLPQLNRHVAFTDRQAMKVGHPKARFHRPTAPLPIHQIPFDWSKALTFPIAGNDIWGDCMLAAAEHADSTFTGNNGTESAFNADLTVSTYLSISGGDNGLSSGQTISTWETGLPSVPGAKIMDALDIDTTDAALVQSAIWLFGGVFFTLDVPDNWYKNFTVGSIWDAPTTADKNNGHGVWWNGVDAKGNYHMETWGTFGWITPAGVADCDPAGFVVFSSRWFNSQGLAPNGMSYSQLASLWTQMGGKTLPAWPVSPTQGDRLLPGQGLVAGGSIKSADGRFTLTMQNDGNLVLAGPQNQALWASATNGHNDVFGVMMQGDGNLVVYDGQDRRVWNSGTNNSPGASLVVQNDGNLVIYDVSGHAVWASNSVVPATPPPLTYPGQFSPGQGLMPGGSTASVDGRFRLAMQGDGNLVLYGPAGQPMWASNTGNHYDIWDVVMQGDGNLVIYDGHGHPLWASNTSGNPGSFLVLQHDGNLVLYSRLGNPLWASNTVVPATPPAHTQSDRLQPGEGLMAGGSITSADGRFQFATQADGNVVLRGPRGQPLWASNTSGRGWDLVMQGDGNLVAYDVHGRPLWASNTSGNAGGWLVMQNDGNAVIYARDGHPLWATNTVVPGMPAAPTQGDRLVPGQGLMAGNSIKSVNGYFRLTMQTDGNLVMYDVYDQPWWSSHTYGHNNSWDAVMQGDGNLVVYDGHGKPLWASNTSGNAGGWLVMQDDGNAVVYNASSHPLWASDTVIFPGAA